MRFKNGVITKITRHQDDQPLDIGLSRKIIEALGVADRISKEQTGKEIIITAALDGKHMTGSLHYKGNAVDLRTRIYTKDRVAELLTAIRAELGSKYDIIDEGDHIHMEWDPPD